MTYNHDNIDFQYSLSEESDRWYSNEMNCNGFILDFMIKNDLFKQNDFNWNNVELFTKYIIHHISFIYGKSKNFTNVLYGVRDNSVEMISENQFKENNALFENEIGITLNSFRPKSKYINQRYKFNAVLYLDADPYVEYVSKFDCNGSKNNIESEPYYWGILRKPI